MQFHYIIAMVREKERAHKTAIKWRAELADRIVLACF